MMDSNLNFAVRIQQKHIIYKTFYIGFPHLQFTQGNGLIASKGFNMVKTAGEG